MRLATLILLLAGDEFTVEVERPAPFTVSVEQTEDPSPVTDVTLNGLPNRRPPAVPPAVTGSYYVVVFGAEWCQPCRRMHQTTVPELQAGGIAVRQLDIDRDDVSRWSVRTVPATWIVERATRRPVRKFTGYLTSQTIVAAIPQPQAFTRTAAELAAERHLRDTHGIHVSGLSMLEMERIHDAEHIRQSGGHSGNWHFPGRVSLE